MSDPGSPLNSILVAENEAPVNPLWYFDSSRWFFKFLRLFNLLEPDRTVLSMTKLILWASTAQSIHAVMTSADWKTIVGSIGINLAAMAKHETRRAANAPTVIDTSTGVLAKAKRFVFSNPEGVGERE